LACFAALIAFPQIAITEPCGDAPAQDGEESPDAGATGDPTSPNNGGTPASMATPTAYLGDPARPIASVQTASHDC
jgi:hypothetical protein